MRNGLLLLAGACLLAACSMDIPNFVGREGDGTYQVGGAEVPDPVTVPMELATAERGLNGVIVRVEGAAPTQGYWGAALVPVGSGEPDAAGAVSFRFVAVPPAGVEAVGPPRTRQLSAGVFVPNRALKTTRAVRISALGKTETLPLPAAPVPSFEVAPEF